MRRLRRGLVTGALTHDHKQYLAENEDLPRRTIGMFFHLTLCRRVDPRIPRVGLAKSRRDEGLEHMEQLERLLRRRDDLCWRTLENRKGS